MNANNLLAGAETVKAAPDPKEYRMPKRWEDMTTDEKLDWLRDFVNNLADTVNHNVGAANHEFAKITDCLRVVEAALQNIATARQTS